MINVSAAGDTGCKIKLGQSSVTETSVSESAQPQEPQDKTDTNKQNGDVHTKKSTSNISKKSSSHFDGSIGPSTSKSNLKHKLKCRRSSLLVTEEVVDLSSDVEEEDENNKNVDKGYKSDTSSSDVLIVEEDPKCDKSVKGKKDNNIKENEKEINLENDNQDTSDGHKNTESSSQQDSESNADNRNLATVNDEKESATTQLDEDEAIKKTTDNFNASSMSSVDRMSVSGVEQISDEESQSEQTTSAPATETMTTTSNNQVASPPVDSGIPDDPISNEKSHEEESTAQETSSKDDQQAEAVLMEVDEIEQDEEETETPSGNSSGGVGKDTVNETQSEGDNFETITGDRSYTEEAVLQNPNVTVCILPNSSAEKQSDPVDPLGQSADDEKNEGQSSDVISRGEMSTSNSRKTTNSDTDKECEGGETATKKKDPVAHPTLIPRPVEEINESAAAAANEKDEVENTSSQSVTEKGDEENNRKMKRIKLYPKKRVLSSELKMVPVPPALRDCLQCAKYTTCSTKVTISGLDCFLCSKECIIAQKLLHEKVIEVGSVLLTSLDDQDKLASTSGVKKMASTHSVDGGDDEKNLSRPCFTCKKEITLDLLGEGDLDSGILQWATMDFCSEECLAKFQSMKGAHCQLCDADVTPMSMGKYSVRFGYETRQFCTSTCLEEFKKGLKACSYCQRDLNAEGDESAGFLAPVGDRGQFKDFCSQDCLEKYDSMSHNIAAQLTAHECAVCSKLKIVRLEVLTSDKTVKLCSYVCFAAYKFVNDKMKISLCDMCKKYFDITAFPEEVMFYEDQPMVFCSKTCMNVQVLSKRKICPCSWCKVKKYNFDMIRKKMNNAVLYMCSLNCLALYQVSLRATIGKQKLKCDWCGKTAKANFHLTMSDASLRNFCSFECVDKFRGQYKMAGLPTATLSSTPSLIVGPGGVVSTSPNNNSILGTTLPTTNTSSTTQPQRNITKNIKVSLLPKQASTATTSANVELPVISSVHSLHNYDTSANRGHVKILPKPSNELVVPTQQTPPAQPQSQQPVASQPPVVPDSVPMTNYQSQPQFPEIIVRPRSPVMVKNKITSVKPRCFTKSTSCRPNKANRSAQTVSDEKEENTEEANPVKHLIPIPVPMYVPTPVAMYSFPLPTLVPVPIPVPVPVFIPTSFSSAKDILKDIERIRESFPQDPIQAELLTMAEAAAEDEQRSTVQANGAIEDRERLSDVDDGMREDNTTNNDRGNKFGSSSRKRVAESPPREEQEVAAKRKRAESQEETDSSERSTISSNKSYSSRMSLKYLLGVNAWKYLANRYNKSSEENEVTNGKDKNLQTDLLKMRHDELNQALTLLMKEGKKPNGESYSPDTKYYLALGVQYYLLINGRIDNIFSDPIYESFTDQLDKEADLFQERLMNSSVSGGDIITRVQEEHLWESRQLGVHSPYVLLSTLMYLNTKQFKLSKLEDHMELSFSHIRKDSSKKGNKSKTLSISSSVNDEEESLVIDEDGVDGNESTGGRSNRSLLLRFYPPQTMLDGDPKKDKVYEQYENEEDPSRCPVRLYEFYLSRCPESVKSRNDVFYLLPERSCAPDSPVWYSNIPLPESIVKKWLNRIKMVKEINVALVTTTQ